VQPEEPTRAALRKAVVATLALQRSAEELLRQAEVSVERRFALSATADDIQLAEPDALALRALAELVREGLRAAGNALHDGGLPDLDEARAREIRLNALELDSRRALLAAAERPSSPSNVALRLAASDLINAYESVGNHLYRLCEALVSSVEQDNPVLAVERSQEERRP
jgi:hypothetical protein